MNSRFVFTPLAVALTGALALVPVHAASAQDSERKLKEVIRAPGTVPVSEAMRVGWAVTQTVETQAGQPQLIHYAVVGEEEEHWQIEHVNLGLTVMTELVAGGEERVMALRVRKDDGRVVEARLGKPGSEEPMLELEILPPPRLGEPLQPKGEITEVELALGTFPCEVYEVEGKDFFNRTWIGTEGELRGVLLKFEGSPDWDCDYELSELPEAGDVRLGDETVKARRLRYSNGDRIVVCDDPVLQTFFPSGKGGMLELHREGVVTLRVTERRTDATPQLRWD